MWRYGPKPARIVEIEGSHQYEFDAIGMWPHDARLLDLQNSFSVYLFRPAAGSHLIFAYFYTSMSIETSSHSKVFSPNQHREIKSSLYFFSLWIFSSHVMVDGNLHRKPDESHAGSAAMLHKTSTVNRYLRLLSTQHWCRKYMEAFIMILIRQFLFCSYFYNPIIRVQLFITHFVHTSI